jgi:hypothetical protein
MPMNVLKAFAVLGFATLTAHCYSSARLTGDSSADGDIDPVADDPDADVAPDLPYECPPPGSFSLDFSISGGTVDPYGAAFDYACTILRFSDDASPLTLDLGCGNDGGYEAVTVTITADPPVYAFFTEGQEVRLNYAAWQPWWADRWLIIYGAAGEGLLLAAVDSSALEPYQGEPFAGYAPLVVTTAPAGLCPPVTDFCGPLRRGALEVGLGGSTTRVFDRNEGWLGEAPLFHIVVDEVSFYDAMECYDVPSSWTTFFIARMPVR